MAGSTFQPPSPKSDSSPVPSSPLRISLPGRIGNAFVTVPSPSSSSIGRKLKLKSEAGDDTDEDSTKSDSTKTESSDPFQLRKTMKRKVQSSCLEEEAPLYMQFLFEAQTSAVEGLVEAFNFLSGLLPVPEDYDITGERFRRLTTGCKVFVKSGVLGTVVEGVITKVHHSDSLPKVRYESSEGNVSNGIYRSDTVLGYSVLLNDGSAIDYLPCADVVYTLAPLFQFASVEDINNKDNQCFEEILRGVIPCTTAHLVKILQFCMNFNVMAISPTSNIPSSTTTSTSSKEGGSIFMVQSLHHLANIVSMVLVGSIIHLSLGTSDLSAIRNQVDIVKKLLRLEPPIGMAQYSFINTPEWISYSEELLKILDNSSLRLRIQIREKPTQQVPSMRYRTLLY